MSLLVISLVLTCAVMIVSVSDAARILVVVPTPSISHQVVFRPLVQELLKRGHELVVITTDPAFPKGKAPANLTEIDMHDFSYEKWRSTFLATTSSEDNDLFNQVKVGLKTINELTIEQLQKPEFEKILKDKSKPFDLLLLEAIARPALALTHILKAPAIQISSFGSMNGNYETMGAPVHPILYPQFLRLRVYNLTFWDKVSELYRYGKILFNSYISEGIENELIKKAFGRDMPEISELLNNVHMMFLNINPIWEGNFPVPPGVIHMGGLHQKPKKELPQALKKYLDDSTNGAIYMSFGTNVNTTMFSPKTIQLFLNVFKKLPYNIIWKLDHNELHGKPANVVISKWLPQSDLLRHPNIKLFITQAGLQSTDEAITAGVPLIGIPLLGDQWYNAEKYVLHKIGVQLDMSSLTEEQLNSAINTVINDKSYAANIRHLNSVMRDQPMKPLERAIWWIEYALRHRGAKHLRSPGANISWSQYLELEFVAKLLFLLTATILLIAFATYYLFRVFKMYNQSLSFKVKSS